MYSKTERELSRNIPHGIPIRYTANSIPLFTAYGCVLLERDTGKSYIYTAVNLKTGAREVISRRATPLTTSAVDGMVEKIYLSGVAGAGALEADRPFGERAALENCREMLDAIFKEALPQYGFNVRHEQLSLSHEMLDAISRRIIFLAEAEVGTGKTFAYLIAALIAKRGRVNGYWNLSFYTGSPYVELAHMPIVIATSSIALQKAIMVDAIPLLSDILMDFGIINSPITAVIRKGREHYVCKRKLVSHIPYEQNHTIRTILEKLLEPTAPIDLAEIDGLTPYVKRRISVPERCDKNCPHRDKCAYLRFREQAASSDIDIQVCNHNYLLADTLRRANDQRPLIPNYQMIIIDEAHKFLQAARSMYGAELSVASLFAIKDMAYSLKFKSGAAQNDIRRAAWVISDQASRLFRNLEEMAAIQDADDECERFSAVLDENAMRFLRNIRTMSDTLMELLNSEPLAGHGAGRKSHLIWELEQIRSQIAAFIYNDNITWLEIENHDTRLCAIPKDLDKRLHEDLWSRGIPTVLTSGTMSAAGDFTRIKRSLGIDLVGNHKIMETSKKSPFNYMENCMYYISENMPFPDQNNSAYIYAAADEIEALVNATHGHAAVLFTSYKMLDMVWEILKDRGIPFPMFKMMKGSTQEIDKFKRSGNGVLFAAGSMWEGIDIPGDALSLVIIVKLPFAVPDPISEYEQTLYGGMANYKECVIKPDMGIRLKQGSGRVLRIETDTGVIAFIDCRMSLDGIYREYALDILPLCHVTSDVRDIELFIHFKKPPEYRLLNTESN